MSYLFSIRNLCEPLLTWPITAIFFSCPCQAPKRLPRSAQKPRKFFAILSCSAVGSLTKLARCAFIATVPRDHACSRMVLPLTPLGGGRSCTGCPPPRCRQLRVFSGCTPSYMWYNINMATLRNYGDRVRWISGPAGYALKPPSSPRLKAQASGRRLR